MGKKLTPTKKNSATPPIRRSSRLSIVSSPPTVSDSPSPAAPLSPTTMLPSSKIDSLCTVSSSPTPADSSDLLITDAVLPPSSVADSPVEAGNGFMNAVAEALSAADTVGPAVFAPSPTATIPTPDPEYVPLSLATDIVFPTPGACSPGNVAPVIVDATATTPAPEDVSHSPVIGAACPSQAVLAPSTGINPQASAAATPENVSVSPVREALSHTEKKRRMRQRYKMNKKMKKAAQNAAAPVANDVCLSTPLAGSTEAPENVTPSPMSLLSSAENKRRSRQRYKMNKKMRRAAEQNAAAPVANAVSTTPLAGSTQAPENVTPSPVGLLSPAEKKRMLRQRYKMNKRMRQAAAGVPTPAPAGAASPAVGPPASVAPCPVATIPATENVVVPATPIQVAFPSLSDKKRKLRQRYKMNKKLKRAAQCQSETAPSISVIDPTPIVVDSPVMVVPIPEAVATTPVVVIPSITSNSRRRKNQNYKMNKKMKSSSQCPSATGASPLAGDPPPSVVDPALATTTTDNAKSPSAEHDPSLTEAGL